MSHHIRIIGHHHATHHHGTILGVTHSHAEAAANASLVHHDHAHDLVKKGDAEWVHAAPADAPAPAGHEELVHRHRGEHADMLSRHATEHREMLEKHSEEHKALAATAVTAAVIGSI